MVVAGCALNGHSHEGSAGRRDPVEHVLEEALLGQRGTAVNDQVKTIEPGSYELIVGCDGVGSSCLGFGGYEKGKKNNEGIEAVCNFSGMVPRSLLRVLS